MKTVIATTAAPGAIGPYSQAIEANGFVFVSGQIPLDPATGAFVPGGVEEQAEQSLRNLKAVLAGAGCTLGDVGQDHRFPHRHGRVRRGERRVRQIF